MRVVALLAGLALLTGACRGDTDTGDATNTTADTVPASTTTTPPADPFAVPATIDAAYVDRVLVELNRVYGDVVRTVRARGRYERGDAAVLLTIFNPPLYERQAEIFGDIPTQDAGLFKDPVGNRVMKVQQLITAGPDCILAKVGFDFSAVLKDPPPANPSYITLKPKRPGSDPKGVNPTPWAMTRETETLENECNDDS